jgi:hypothetical protein
MLYRKWEKTIYLTKSFLMVLAFRLRLYYLETIKATVTFYRKTTIKIPNYETQRYLNK